VYSYNINWQIFLRYIFCLKYIKLHYKIILLYYAILNIENETSLSNVHSRENATIHFFSSLRFIYLITNTFVIISTVKTDFLIFIIINPVGIYTFRIYFANTIRIDASGVFNSTVTTDFKQYNIIHVDSDHPFWNKRK